MSVIDTAPQARVLCLELSMASAYARDVMLGVRRYVGCGTWQILVREPNLGTVKYLTGPGRDLVAGVIGHLADPGLEQAHAGIELPIVNVSGARPDQLLPSVLPDNREAGRLAARHLLKCGLRQFAFFGEPPKEFSADRQAGFAEELARSDFSCRVCDSSRPTRHRELLQLPKPAGVLAATDKLAAKLIGAAHERGILVPEELAIVGITNDETECELAAVTLSSVDLDAERLGFEAAALLVRMIEGERPPERPVRVRPMGVVIRASTDMVATEDVLVREAVAYMRMHACDPLTVKQVVRHVGGARRTLEERFRRSIGRTPHQEIRRIQIERACELLRTTDLPVPLVASRSGFADAKRFSKTFRDAVGSPPNVYRKHYRIT